jgi:hypothetical protein
MNDTWNPATHGKYGKKDFIIDLKAAMVSCPAENKQKITGKSGNFRAKFSSKVCAECPIKNKYSDSKTGRTIQIHEQEAMLQTLKHYITTPEGRNEARERVKVELLHIRIVSSILSTVGLSLPIILIDA